MPLTPPQRRLLLWMAAGRAEPRTLAVIVEATGVDEATIRAVERRGLIAGTMPDTWVTCHSGEVLAAEIQAALADP